VNQVQLAGALLVSYVVGAVPFSQIVARLTAGTDLRLVGTGTVSPLNLRRAAGVRPAVVAGIFEVVKGTAGPLLVGADRQGFAALAGALAVTGHVWSPFLKGAGGRGLATATGALMVAVWPGAVVMCTGLIVGVITRRVVPAMGVALFALLPVVLWMDTIIGMLAATLIMVPIGAKTGIVIYQRRRNAAKPS
jgi:glycerol-3-phosphate acyltransferase PlsY